MARALLLRQRAGARASGNPTRLSRATDQGSPSLALNELAGSSPPHQGLTYIGEEGEPGYNGGKCIPSVLSFEYLRASKHPLRVPRTHFLLRQPRAATCR